MKIICCLKHFVSLAVFFIFLVTGCAHNPVRDASAPPSEVASPTLEAPAVNVPSSNPAEISAKPESVTNADEDFFDEIDEIKDGEALTIADPLEPFNRAMHSFNDKLYFWLLKPVAQGYNKVIPERARVSVNNFFSNLGFPARFLNCLLQADFRGAATEFGRFGINTIWGIGGLMDPAAGKDLDLRKQDTDLGLTLAYYGVEHGFYLVWPVFGPSSPRDSLAILSDNFLYPVSYLNPWYYWLGTKSLQMVNETSLRIGDYESLKDAAIDPYVAFRDAYLQYRLKKVKSRVAKTQIAKTQDK